HRDRRDHQHQRDPPVHPRPPVLAVGGWPIGIAPTPRCRVPGCLPLDRHRRGIPRPPNQIRLPRRPPLRLAWTPCPPHVPPTPSPRSRSSSRPTPPPRCSRQRSPTSAVGSPPPASPTPRSSSLTTPAPTRPPPSPRPSTPRSVTSATRTTRAR